MALHILLTSAAALLSNQPNNLVPDASAAAAIKPRDYRLDHQAAAEPPPPHSTDESEVPKTTTTRAEPAKIPSQSDPATATVGTAKPRTSVPNTSGTNVGSAVAGLQDSATTLAPPDPILGLFGLAWDSGEQQCQVGDNKINYRFRSGVEPIPKKPWTRRWWVTVKASAEDKKKTGSGWKQVPALLYVRYTLGHPGEAPKQYTYHFKSKKAEEAVLQEGEAWDGFTTLQFRIVRSGGSSGVRVDWPGSGCSPD